MTPRERIATSAERDPGSVITIPSPVVPIGDGETTWPWDKTRTMVTEGEDAGWVIVQWTRKCRGHVLSFGIHHQPELTEMERKLREYHEYMTHATVVPDSICRGYVDEHRRRTDLP